MMDTQRMMNVKPLKSRGNLSLSKLQSPITTQWLHNNYELQDGTTLPRSSLYEHYMDFCSKSSIIPVNAASFGKIIRLTFPDLKTRRLGTRGKSKYHYYGIAVKVTSPYYNIVLQQQEKEEEEEEEEVAMVSKIEYNNSLQSTNINEGNADDVKFEKVHCTAKVEERICVPTTKQKQTKETTNNYDNSLTQNVTLLPEFPTVESTGIHEDFVKDKVKTFLIMYRAHCQRILDTIFRANFTEVEKFLVHFWQGMPSHILMILSHEAVIEVVGICDNILYKAIGDVLIPSSLQPLPTSLTQAIQHFAKKMTVWLEIAMFHLPEELQNKKLAVAKTFCQSLLRQTSLSHLAQAARTVVEQQETALQMSDDLKEIQIEQVIKQVIWLSPVNMNRDARLVKQVFEEFSEMLDKQSTIEDYIEWISGWLNKCVVQPSGNTEGSFQSIAQEFLLKWSFITSKIIQELTLRSAKSFGSFHLLQMLFDDYIFYLIESHADISEEICDTPQVNHERNNINNNKMKKVLSWSPSYTETARKRQWSTSSSGRGSLSPQEYYNTESGIFTYPNGIVTYNHPSNYNRMQFNPQQQTQIFPYDMPTAYDTVKTDSQLKLPATYNNNNDVTNSFQNFNQSNRLPASFNQPNPIINPFHQNTIITDQSESLTQSNYDETTNQSDYYSNDLEVVRQLQERTKSLMEATNRYDLTYENEMSCVNNTNSYTRI